MAGKRIAVVGGGIFGVTAAVHLARQGYRVELFEHNRDLLMAASGINQYRLHRGYHYPRSLETAVGCLEAEAEFQAEYGPAVLPHDDHYYCLAKRGSLVSAEQYLAFCRQVGLTYATVWTPLVRREAVDLCVKVEERLFDPAALRQLAWQKLREAGIPVHLGTSATPQLLAPYEFVVVATYAAINALVSDFPAHQKVYQFELCEKPVVRLPRAFAGQSVVIIDGPFMCVDPMGRTGLFVLGNVVHAIHHANIGKAPEVDARYQAVLNQGIVANPPITKFSKFIESASEFLPDLSTAEHVGSMFTVRTVPPYKEATDERPTIVERIGERIITVFSGKISTCVQAAHEVAELIADEDRIQAQIV